MKIKLKILTAKNGSKYLRVVRLDKKDKTLIIFENQEWIIDYIYYKLDIHLNLSDWNKQYHLQFLKSFLKKPSDFEVFKNAVIIQNELKDHWNSFNHPLYSSYDSAFYSMDSFDDSCINYYDYWGKDIRDIFAYDKSDYDDYDDYDDYNINKAFIAKLDKLDWGINIE